MRFDITPAMFFADVSDHALTVKLNAGLYRHLHFSKRGTCVHWFDLVTWPGVLVIRGDMGTWVFSRVEDMFTLFRAGKGESKINPDYWAEKLCAGINNGREHAKVFDSEEFQKRVLEHLENYCSLEGQNLAAVTEALRDEVFREDNQHDLYRAAYDFKCGLPDGETFHFDGCEIPSGMVFSFHFLWCCHAIVWGIEQWDNQAKESARAVS